MGKKKKEWKEADLVLTFKLKRHLNENHPLLEEWLNVENPLFLEGENYIFDNIYPKVVEKIAGWSEEDLKMKFITFVLELGRLTDFGNVITFFDKMISAKIEGIELSVRTDFMVASGFMNVYHHPYFHFQEYKPHLNPTGEPMAQLLEAFLIAQVKNNDDKPLYGAEVIGKQWTFVVMKGKDYYISKSYDCTDKEELLKIIAILRKFKEILETKLLK
jgi:hypothetical protein